MNKHTRAGIFLMLGAIFFQDSLSLTDAPHWVIQLGGLVLFVLGGIFYSGQPDTPNTDTENDRG